MSNNSEFRGDSLERIPSCTMAVKGGEVFSDNASTPLHMEKCVIHMNIKSNVCETTYIMTFYNCMKKTLEGELIFPLTAGSSVHSYGLDVNGVIVNAVPVEKKKARVAFESEVRKRGKGISIAEKVSGSNLFKTRVYPMPPEGRRTVKIIVISQLIEDDSARFAYVPFTKPADLKKFEFRYDSAAGTDSMIHTSDGDFKKMEPKCIDETSDLIGLVLKIPKSEDDVIIEVERDPDSAYHYFSTTFTNLSDVLIERELVLDYIRVYFDVSHSRQQSQWKKELEFLKQFIEHHKQKLEKTKLTIQTNTFSCEIHEQRTFRGDQHLEMIEYLSKQRFDGGTCVPLDPMILPSQHESKKDEVVLLFSDGISNYGRELEDQFLEADRNPKSYQTPIYCISTSQKASHDLMRYICRRTGGRYFNLSHDSVGECVNKTKNRPQSQVISVRAVPQLALTEIQVGPVRANGSLVLFGRVVDASEEPVLSVHFGDVATKTVKFRRDLFDCKSPSSSTLIRTLWAQKKIEKLSIFPTKNKEEIMELGLKYGIVTEHTSLIVMTELSQYLEYEIIPPKQMKQMRKQYLNHVQKEKLAESELKKLKIDRVLTSWRKRIQWHQRYLTEEQKRVRKPSIQFLEEKEEKEEEEEGEMDDEEVEVPPLDPTKSKDQNEVDATSTPLSPSSDMILDEDEYSSTTETTSTPTPTAPEKRIKPKKEETTSESLPTPKLPPRKSAPRPRQSRPVQRTSYGSDDDDDAFGCSDDDVDFSLDEDDDDGDFCDDSEDECDEDEEDMDHLTENIYYESKCEMEEDNESAIEGFQNILLMEVGKSKWGYKALKLLMRCYFRVQEYDNMYETFKKLLFYVDVYSTSQHMDYVDRVICRFQENETVVQELRNLKTLYDQDRLPKPDDIPDGLASETSRRVTATRRPTREERRIERLESYFKEIQHSMLDVDYIRKIDAKSRSLEECYEEYLRERSSYMTNPAFYLNCADYFLSKMESKSDGEEADVTSNQVDPNSSWMKIGIRILTNIVEIEPNNPQLLRIVGYRLSSSSSSSHPSNISIAKLIFEKVLKERPEEPQSYRDLALVLEMIGTEKCLFDSLRLLWSVITMKIDKRFDEIEITAAVEMNHVLKTIERKLGIPKRDETVRKLRIHPEFIYFMDCDLRISMAWDTDMTDIDLHVYDPDNEHCYYSHKETKAGGMISRDFVSGYGPEEFLQFKCQSGKFHITAKYFSSHQQGLTGGTTILCSIFKNYMGMKDEGNMKEEKVMKTLRLASNKEDVYVSCAQF